MAPTNQSAVSFLFEAKYGIFRRVYRLRVSILFAGIIPDFSIKLERINKNEAWNWKLENRREFSVAFRQNFPLSLSRRNSVFIFIAPRPGQIIKIPDLLGGAKTYDLCLSVYSTT